MNLTAIDWAIVIGYFALSMGIGLVFTKKGGESIEEYFLSGRNVSWWLAGASMVATTFAADTPLVVTGLVFNNGVAGNWLWWNMLMSGMLTVFFFARLWRRAGVMTDVEFAELRYSGKPAAALRGFRALYLAIPINLIILGWVTRAMIKILTISLGLRDVHLGGLTISGDIVAVGICFVITVAYSAGAGMWAVLWTDLVQFVIKMTAVIILAVFAVRAVGGMDALVAGLSAKFGSSNAAISVLPVRVTPNGLEAYTWMPLLALAVFLSVQWWAAWYPGAEPGGGGYVAQRIFSSKTERDGVLATLFFQVAHYAIRPWPWIITGLATVLLYPAGIGAAHDHEAAYVQAFVDLLPTPWRGFMMAGFAAAYMSTVGTQLNWGASYLVNDFYKRFVNKDASEKHYVAVSRWATVLLFLGSVFVTMNLTTVEGAWKFLLALGSGTGLVLILRWYWWRINAWSEISAMVASFLVSITAIAAFKGRFPAGDLRADAWVMLTTVLVSTIIWVSVTFMTAPEPESKLESFYQRVRPGGPGWRRISDRLGYGGESIPGGALAWTNWLAGIVAVYASLFGIGKLIFGETMTGLIMLVVAALAFGWIAKAFREEDAGPRAQRDVVRPVAAD
ncbi:MAG: Na+:solute symporter [Gemmatimonadaceae bacterium]|nr:Na+:solute symporter [Gemmatimonadaceae bacterium]NUO93884.1 Na+:solute symporter [Gemmatimonadaceae bacterium]NUP56143.1 Na+:solute symporter [Gemmatimonadaceae bacterium]NUP70975.1 Na+:solute symporter [Gemmatimonadaceae bacterium]NUR35375.1 Na+:solute symporter [Gemmatimonadaceae bacterium]